MRTSRLERGLVVVIVCLLPFDRSLGIVEGVGLSTVAFAALGLTVALRDPQHLLHVLLHRLALPVYAFLAVTFAMELIHPATSFSWWSRVAQSFLSLLVIAAACRDRRLLTTALWASVVVACVVAVPFVLSTYGSVDESTAETFTEASRVRSDVVAGTAWFQFGINAWAFLVAQGAGLALALGMLVRRQALRTVCFGAAGVLGLATLLSFSRGNAAVLVVTACAVVLVSRGRTVANVVRLGLVVVLVAVLVPAAVLPRLSIGTAGEGRDARAEVFGTTVDTAGEWALVGVGSGNYWSGWAEERGFPMKSSVAGSHNAYAQVAIQWGLPGIGALAWILVAYWRRLRRASQDDRLRPALLGLYVSMLVGLLFTHGLYAKHFAIGLGLVLGYVVWIGRRPTEPSPVGGSR